jgi:hypothetical protein
MREHSTYIMEIYYSCQKHGRILAKEQGERVVPKQEPGQQCGGLLKTR